MAGLKKKKKKRLRGKLVQIRKEGAKEPENPRRDNGAVPREVGPVQKAGASAQERKREGPKNLEEELVCS